MANELMIPTGNLPSHITSLFSQLSGINRDASDGISAGMYPLIKTSGTRFVLVKDGEEEIVKTLELKVVVLKAKPGFEKRYYARAYDPNSTDAAVPDCFSMNGQTPDPSCSSPQNPSCSGCHNNVFGSGKDNNGNPGKGKACSDRKLLAVLYPNSDTKALEIYGLSLPPASLKAFGAYVNTLSAANIPLPAAFTVVGFDEKSTYPVLTFKYGGILQEKELGQIVPMIESPEVKAIIDSKAPAVSPVAPAKATTPAPASVEDSGFGFTPEPAKEKKPRAAKPAPSAADSAEDVSDEDLGALLGIKL